MKSKRIHDKAGERTFVLVFQTGDAAMKELKGFLKEHPVGAARFTAIGALSSAILGYFDWEKKEYRQIPVNSAIAWKSS